MGSHVEMKKVSMGQAGLETDVYDAIMEHRETLLNIAYSYLRNRHDALEALQEMTCRAWVKRSTLKDGRALKAWLIRILIYVCIDEQRRRKRAVPTVDEQLEEISQPHDAFKAFNHDKVAMGPLLEKVKPKYRHVLILKYYNDLTLTEIAAVLGKPEGTVKTWQHKGLGQLRKWMKNRRDWE